MSTSPEFVMPPPPVVTAAPASAPLAVPELLPDAVDREAPVASRVARLRGRLGRTLLAVGAAGMVVGALAQTGVTAIASATSEAQLAALQAVGMDYLTAIAEGRAADATAMVPPGRLGEVAPDAVLADAAPIRDYSASIVGRVDDGAAVVLVKFTVGAVEVDRLLDAQLADGGWRLLTSLAEAPSIYQDHQLAQMVLGGVEIDARSPMLLYPGAYRPDVIDSGLYRTVGGTFAIDGDPDTRHEVWSGVELDMEAAVTARGLAVATVEACQAAASCEVPADAEISLMDEAVLLSVETRSGDVTIGTTVGVGDRWLEVRMRASHDPDTGLTQWQCPEPARLDLPVVPCGR
jgi:hypothetical protein